MLVSNEKPEEQLTDAEKSRVRATLDKVLAVDKKNYEVAPDKWYQEMRISARDGVVSGAFQSIYPVQSLKSLNDYDPNLSTHPGALI